MTKTRLISFALIPLVIYLSYLLFNGINSEIELAKAIKNSEAKVIDKLKLIRSAEKAYFAKYDMYTDKWDSLIMFVNQDTFFITEKEEIIIQRKHDDPRAYLGDSVHVKIDTLGWEPMKEHLFPAEKFPNFNVNNLKFIPGTDNKVFEIFAGKIDKGGVTVDVIEVVDKFPLDKSRSDENPNPRRWFLRFGSKTDVTTSGNWE
ncbi:hypothetical protein AAG747_09520 [Rapidithrix thailandica]|uniref:Uncharacterized protein n=1 Tax=Rapidithrix thailandica TaxID=413964 RepID=A0AAW9S6Z2_9BACT